MFNTNLFNAKNSKKENFKNLVLKNSKILLKNSKILLKIISRQKYVPIFIHNIEILNPKFRVGFCRSWSCWLSAGWYNPGQNEKV